MWIRKIKNGKYQLEKMVRYRYIVVLIKSQGALELVPNLQHWVKNMLEMLVIQHTSIQTIFILIVLITIQKMHKCNFHYVAIPMVTPQILKSVAFTKTWKSRYLENKTWFFLQIKEFINYTSSDTFWQKIVL